MKKPLFIFVFIITFSIFLSSTVFANSYTVTIHASDPYDYYVRDWNIFTVDPSGTYVGGGVWEGGVPLITSIRSSGSTWTVSLNDGTYYLVIGQSGGTSYGTYSGEINVSGVSTDFTGADVNHAIQFTVSTNQSNTTTCTDTDWFGQTSSQHIQRLATKGTCTDQNGVHTDYCVDGNMLTDYYCGPLMQDPKSCMATTYGCQAYGFTGCSNGACINATCGETDNGKDYYTKGRITGTVIPEGIMLYDMCYLIETNSAGALISSTPVASCEGTDSRCKLNENWCEGSSYSYEQYHCPYGCSDGACIQYLGPTARGFGQVQVLNPWSLAASNGALSMRLENRVGGTVSITRVTMDMGSGAILCDVNPDVSMNAGEQKTVTCVPTYGWTPKNAGDMYSVNVVIYFKYDGTEFSTSGTMSGTYSESTCTDSDGGKNYYVKGTTVGLASGGVMTTRVDSCWEPNHYGDGYDYVAEWFCWDSTSDGKTYAINTNQKCIYGCKDGACLNQTCQSGYTYDWTSPSQLSYHVQTCIKKETNVPCTYLSGTCNRTTYLSVPKGKRVYAYLDNEIGITDVQLYSGKYYYSWRFYNGNNITRETFSTSVGYITKYTQDSNQVAFKATAGYTDSIDIVVESKVSAVKCINHNECSQACDSIDDFHWSGSKSNSWTGPCKSMVYGCMTGDCGIGQCNSTTGTCFCLKTNVVDIYGSVCPTGTTCGDDLYCHPIQNVTCTDSDGGLNYYTKGTTFGKRFASSTEPDTESDSCSDSTTLIEYTCSDGSIFPTGVRVGNTYSCPYGCKDGACIQNASFVIKGRLIDKFSGKPLSNVLVKHVDNSNDWNDLESAYTNSNGEFEFKDSTYKTGYILYFSPDCYSQAGIVGEKNQQTGGYEFYLYDSSEYCNEKKIPVVNGVVNLGNVGLQPAADIEFTSDVPVAFTIYMKSKYCSYDIGGSGNSLKKTEHYLSNSIYLNYENRLVLNEWTPSEVVKSDFHMVPYKEGCYKIRVSYKNGVFEWSDLISKNQVCTDSDGGNNPSIKGYAAGYAANGEYIKIDDRCLLRSPSGGGSYVNSCSGTMCALEEAVCSNGYVATYSPGGIGIPCEAGCTNGACSNYIQSEEYKTVVLGEEFYISKTSNNPYMWSIESYDDNYLDGGIGTTGCSSTGRCTFSTMFKALREGTTKIVMNRINTNNREIVEKRYIYVTIRNSINYVLSVKTDKYTYSPGETVNIISTLTGENYIDFSNAYIDFSVVGPDGSVRFLNPSRIGAVSSACSQSETGGTYSCVLNSSYSFVAMYPTNQESLLGVYSANVEAKIGDTTKGASTPFEIRSEYTDYVDVSITPREQTTTIGNPVSYRVTVKDNHPLSDSRNYAYEIEVSNLPYNIIHQNLVTVPAGGSTTFDISIFPSAASTEKGVEVSTEQVTVTDLSDYRQSSPTGAFIATSYPIAGGGGSGSVEAVPIEVAGFKFTVSVTLVDDHTVKDSDTAVLYVKYSNTPQPPDFPEDEIITEYLREGWNLLNLPGKGTSFVDTTCSLQRKPFAYVYLHDQRRYVSIQEAAVTTGIDPLFDYVSIHPLWIYSYENCEISVKVAKYATYSGVSLVRGWNMLGTTKDMVGETMNSIKGSCEFENIYRWNADSQNWIKMSGDDLIEKISNGLVVKATSDCNLKQNSIQPPIIS